MDAAPQSGELTLTATAVEAPLAVVLPAPQQSGIPAGLLHELAATASITAVALTPHEFASALTTIGAKHNFGLPPEATASPAQQEKFYRSLQLQDLALAQACALGREPAWQQFLARFRAPLQQAAIAITHSSSLGEELADSLYAELYGLSERNGQRRSPIAGYSGRGSLHGWLRTTLAQRHVDHYRRTYRETPLPEYETAQETSSAFTTPATDTPDDAQLTHLTAALSRVMQSLPPDDRFLLAAYFLDQHTLLEISRLLHVHEATVSRKLKRLTGDLQKQLLKQLQADGLSKRAAQEALSADPRDLTLNLRSILQTSQSQPFSPQQSSLKARAGKPNQR